MNEPTPLERAGAWGREDPAELRRAAAEWDALGYHAYAGCLRGWAAYRAGLRSTMPPVAQSPW